MSTGWENHEPAPMEFFHAKLMEYFHEWRKTRVTVSADGTSNTGAWKATDYEIPYVVISGSEFSDIIVKAKNETYAKYPKQKLQDAILKSEM